MNLWSVNLLKEGTPRENVGRFDIVWPLPGILSMKKDPARKDDYHALLSWFMQSVASDFERHQPDMLINDISTIKRSLPDYYNILNLLKTDPRFSTAFSRYERVDILEFCDKNNKSLCAFEIFYRK